MKLLLASLLAVNIGSNPVRMSKEIYTSELQNRVVKRLGELESSNNYSAVNRLRYVGKYQFGAARLEDLGYVKKGCYNKHKNAATFLRGCLTSKKGFTDLGSYLINKGLQESIIRESLRRSYNYLIKRNHVPDSKAKLAAYLMAAHLSGDKGAYEYITSGKERSDANNTKTSKYYQEGLGLYK